MLIDWFTVIAQVINFLILVWLLKRFLYRPILKAIEEREKRIASQIQEAERKKAEAEKERENLHRRNEELAQMREQLLQQIENEAEAERQRLAGAARAEYDQLRTRLKESLEQEQMDLSRDIIRHTQNEVFAIARQVLADLADANLEERMAGAFTQQMQNLDAKERDRLRTALTSSGGPVSIRTVFDLPAGSRSAIEKTLQESFGPGLQLQFETIPNAIAGIELTANGYRVAWTINEYLSSLEERLTTLVNEGSAATTTNHGKR